MSDTGAALEGEIAGAAEVADAEARPGAAAAEHAAGVPQAAGGGGMESVFDAIGKRTDIALALGVVAILVVLILPMPSWLLDMSLAISITFSVLILMTVLFIDRPLEFSSFPTVLLIATMIRLSLNLASTRLILADGNTGPDAAGRVIEAFGAFVMGGNPVIGVIVFSILVIVNFIVITKGSGRIAEVSARFSLDAMPGKQMAIDADLSAGLINEDEARTRRRTLEDESSFFGSMDGAAKFVRGDAIAGLLITLINIVGGVMIGTLQHNMGLGDATSTYMLLTVGDGLVTQIPALIVSTAAGMLVTKSGVVGSADKAVFGQLGAYPQAMALASFLLVCLSLLPGLPMLPFLSLAMFMGMLAYTISQRERQRVAQEIAKAAEEEAAPPPEEPISAALTIDQIRLEMGYALLPLINEEQERPLTEQIKAMRRQLAVDMGFVVPPVRIQDNLQLPPTAYVLRVKELEGGRGDLRPNMLLVMDPQGQPIDLTGEETTEPTFGLPAMWIQEQGREEAMFRGYTVVDPPTVITTHLTEIIKDNMAEMLSYAETQKLLDGMSDEHQKLVSDVIPSQISVGGVQRVLQTLLSERVSIRDLATILEGISEACGYTRSVTQITEHVRTRLARQISEENVDSSGAIPMVTLSPEWEQAFAESIVGQGDDKQLSMAPSNLQEFIAKVREVFDQQAVLGENPVLLTSPPARPFVRSIIERFRPSTVVLSQNEVHPRARIRTMAQV